MSYMSNNFDKIQSLEEYLQALADSTSLTPTQMKKIVDRYESVGGFLDREGSSIKHLNPRVSPQGSVLLGTANRPINDKDELDVDLVCLLQDGSKATMTQAQLKRLITEEIKLYAKAQNMMPPHEGRRCVTLEYRDETDFHVDILPACSDAEGMRSNLRKQALSDGLRQRLLGSISDSSIAITCTEHPNFNRFSMDWPVSNPEGYGKWFASQQSVVLLEKRTAIFDGSVHANVDDIPLHDVRTPLQDVVKILKWDRDVTLGNDDDKPISVIITTLAARAYRGETTLTAALNTILTTMDESIEVRDGVTWIANPTNPVENFADRWEGCPRKERLFRSWLKRARQTYLAFMRQPLSETSSHVLNDSVQPRIVESLNKRLSPELQTPTPAAPAVIRRQVERVQQQRQPERPWSNPAEDKA
ncbi:MAG: nucleotidyltransferase [Litorimonas sp.]